MGVGVLVGVCVSVAVDVGVILGVVVGVSVLTRTVEEGISLTTGVAVRSVFDILGVTRVSSERSADCLGTSEEEIRLQPISPRMKTRNKKAS